MKTTEVIDRLHLDQLLISEQARFAADHPKCHQLYERAKKNLLSGVPMNWMVKWAGVFPMFVEHASGAHFSCVDGRRFVDLCLGDTGAMTGHAPEETVTAVVEQLRRGLTFMLPTEDSIAVSSELSRRFGLPYWQIAMTATDANRFSIRIARALTKRKYILVFNYCYHGTVDETFISLKNGVAQARQGNLGPPVPPTETTRVVEFNDLDALEKALSDKQVACVLAEPAMTNIGIIHPQPGYHDALREITARTGTLLILDETHTICAGPAGYTGAHNLKPDILTIGKPIAGGVPAAAYGFTELIADKFKELVKVEDCDTVGIGGTLSGNALALAAMKATLLNVLTEQAYDRMIPLATRFTDGVQAVIEEKQLPWTVQQLGCRAEYWFRPVPPLNGGEAAASADPELDRYMHLAALNRGVLMTPFHNMALMSPATSEADVDLHTRVFKESVQLLLG